MHRIAGDRTAVKHKEAERERLAVEDAAAVVRARTRRAEVDDWEAKQTAAVAVEADRKRVEHEKTAIDAVQRLRARGETVKTIAMLCGLTESEIRKYARQAVKSDPAPTVGGEPGALAESTQGPAPQSAPAGDDARPLERPVDITPPEPGESTETEVA